MSLTVVIVVLTALFFSAFFSGMEIAFVSSNRLKLEIDKKQNRMFNYILGIFTRRPGQYITTILVGNNIALVVYSLNMTLLINAVAHHYGWTYFDGSVLFDTLISTIVIIFTAEFIPKTVVRVDPNFYLRIFAIPVYLFYVLLYPIAKFSTWISINILRMIGLRVKRHHDIQTFDRVDLTHLLEEVAEHESSEHRTDTEIKLFQNALDFSDLRVRDCMVPRVDIVAVESTSTIAELTQKFVDSQFSRIFVYDSSIDNIIGYINTKSLFTSPQSIAEVLMQVDYVTESMSAQRLLTSFIKKKRSVAVVIDEFGGTAGMVSLEDVLEEIFGDIEDEHDSPDTVEKVVNDSEYILSSRLEVEYLNQKYDLELKESDEYETLGGYIIFHYGGIPSQGEVITLDNKEIKILRMSSSKLDLVRVKLLD